MRANKILEITVPNETKTIILEKIKKYISRPVGFFHIVSLNPENLVVAQKSKQFKQVLETAQIKIIDGVGVVLAGKILGVEVGERVTGVELIEELMNLSSQMRLRVLFIGGRPNLALRLAQCYSKKFSQAKFLGMEGIKNIKNLQQQEEAKIFSIVSRFKPHFVLAAFGSPDQERWLWRNRKKFAGGVGMGVGGAFDYLTGIVPRAPGPLRRLGLEWLFRLLVQPCRWRRQIRLIKFIYLVLKQKVISN